MLNSMEVKSHFSDDNLQLGDFKPSKIDIRFTTGEMWFYIFTFSILYGILM